MEDLSKAIDEALSDREEILKNGGTQGTHGSILRRRVKLKPQENNTREAE
ncbi:MAG: hypothetical protein F6J98_02730 [Moorea sp. SIO4G2]|nr:hypothetical protein [Moorena sp. SIO4G2]